MWETLARRRAQDVHHRARALEYDRSGLFGTMATVAREEGARALWKGLEPGEIL